MLHLKTRTGYNGNFIWLDHFIQRSEFLLSMIDKIDQVNRDARGVLTYAGLC